MMEPNPSLKSEMSPMLSSRSDGELSVLLTNASRFTCKLESGLNVGTVEVVELVTATDPAVTDPPLTPTESDVSIRSVRSPTVDKARRKQAFCDAYREDSKVPPEAREIGSTATSGGSRQDLQ